ncbi:MAG: hypothetical protein VX335_00810, partial [Pseudomonadota bacterium]|nr:hypothetical protein [Pseudomonadota bacterium]
MQTDKIIYNALVARKSKKDFQKELRKSGLLGTYRSEVLFFKTCGHLKIPHICYENNYHKRISEKLVLKENIMLFLNIFLFILAACIFTESLINMSDYAVYELVIVPLSCIIVMLINLRLIARASG